METELACIHKNQLNKLNDWQPSTFLAYEKIGTGFWALFAF
jgi:hypothetical protein